MLILINFPYASKKILTKLKNVFILIIIALKVFYVYTLKVFNLCLYKSASLIC